MHVELLQNSSDVIGLRQKQLSRFSIPCDLHPENVVHRTEVLHRKLQLQFSSELGKLSSVSTGE